MDYKLFANVIKSFRFSTKWFLGPGTAPKGFPEGKIVAHVQM